MEVIENGYKVLVMHTQKKEYTVLSKQVIFWIP